MKQFSMLSLIVTFVFTLSAVSQALDDKTEGTTQQQSTQQDMMHEGPMIQPDMMKNEEVLGTTFPATLEQIAEKLSQENLTADMQKEIAHQIKTIADSLEVRSGMMGNTTGCMPMMNMMSGDGMMGNTMGHMPMMNMMSGDGMMGNTMGHMPMMNMMSGGGMMGNTMGHMPMMHRMHGMMHGEHEHDTHDAEESGLQLQMRGEIMQAVGEILQKYGKLIVEEE